MKQHKTNQKLELDLITQAIYLRYGIDFRDYSLNSLYRRLMRRLKIEGLHSLGEMQHKVIYEPEFFHKVYQDFSVQVTEMFRDTSFFQLIKNEVLSQLKPKMHLKVWVAGCATGEEIFSLAILFHEAGLYEKTDFYATDMNTKVINQAKTGDLRKERIPRYNTAYHSVGGKGDLLDYLDIQKRQVKIKPWLLENIVFADHNLAQDQAFAEMDLIVCRNVLIYFNKDLQKKVLQLFRASLIKEGFIGFGMQESLYFSDYADEFQEISSIEKLYQWNG